MRSDNNEVYVLASARTPFTKSQTNYLNVSRKKLMTASLNFLIEKAKLQGQLIGDTALGAVVLSAADWNLARECVLETSLNPESPAYNIQRACGTSLEATWQIALKAMTGSINIGIAGGVDTNSDVPLESSDAWRNVWLELYRAKTWQERLYAWRHFGVGALIPKMPSIVEPRTHLSMGEHCELMAKEWQITREAQDELALASHMNAAKAYASGFFNDLVYPFEGLTKDSVVRADTSMEKLAKLKPAFDKVNGTLTAGNSSPLSDGSACVLIGNQKGAEQANCKPLAKIIDVEVAAVDFVHGAGLLMAPTKAVATLLTRNKLTFQDFDFIEIHEAFAAQVLCNLKAWESENYCRDVLKLSSALGAIDRNKLNVMGSSVAVGHPYAATGARIVGTLAKMLSNSGKKRGLISICTAGGMGVAAILESV